MKTFLVHPEIRESLRRIGEARLTRDAGRSLLGAERSSIVACTDYAGDDAHAEYDTQVAYVTAWNEAQPLVNRLSQLRRAHGIEERTIDFKGRRDARKLAVLAEWMSAFAEHPGIVVAQAFDKRPLPGRAAVRKAATADARAAGISANVLVAERAARAISFLAVVAHLFSSDDRFLWLSDRDAIFGLGDTLANMLASYMNVLVPRGLRKFGYTQWHAHERCDPEWGPHVEGQRLLLSLPDLVAGALAHRLPSPFGSATVSTGPTDPGAAIILRALASFSQTDLSPGRCHLVSIVWRADAVRDVLEPRIVGFEPATSGAAE